MYLIRLGVILVFVAGCTNLPISSQNYRIVARNLNLWSAVVDANEAMIAQDMNLGVIVSSEDGEISPTFHIANSTLSATQNSYFRTLAETSKDVCIVLYRFDIPSPPSSTTCFELAAVGNAIRTNRRSISINASNISSLQKSLSALEVVVSQNTKDIKENSDKIALGTEATLKIFQMSATNGNIIVAQNEFFDSVRVSTASIDRKVSEIDKRFTGFQASITQQMSALNVNVSRLRSAVAQLAAQ